MRNRITLIQTIFLTCCVFFSYSVAAQTLIINTIAGNGTPGFVDGGLATAGEFHPPTGVAVNRAGNTVFVADELNNRIRKVYLTSASINTVAGGGSVLGDGGAALAASLNAPFGVAADSAGNIYIADNQDYRIRKINTSGIINTIAGTGVLGYLGDGLPATNARIGNSHGMTVDGVGNVYFSDIVYNVVRKIDAAGIITTVAGNGASGFAGDGGPATAATAQLNTPRGLRVDAAGNLYIADVGNNRIRKVDLAGNISTIAGGGFSPMDGIPATTAGLSSPWDVAIDATGNIYITDYGDNSIRVVSTAGIINTIAGGGAPDFSGDGCAATAAQLNSPMYMVFDTAGNLYFSDELNYRVRVISKNNAPLFCHGHSQSLTICEDTGGTNIDTFLAASDADANQPETWSLITAAAHGTAMAAYSTTSTGGLMTPTGVFYSPDIGYTGNDSFTVSITDCTGATDTTTIYVTVSNCSLTAPQPAPEKPGVLSVFPNPGSGAFTINISSGNNENVLVTVRNMMGEKVKEVTTTTNKATVIPREMPPGVYFITATSASGTHSTKLTVR